jgi:hypothetical protein
MPAPIHAQAQSSDEMMSVRSSNFRTQFPVSRPLATPPDVATTGTFVNGSTRTALPVTAWLARADLMMYGQQLRSLFPLNAVEEPTDSLADQYGARAEAWMVRLRRVYQTRPPDDQLVAMAWVAVQAGLDTTAQRLIDIRLRQLSASPMAQVSVLTAAVEAWTNQPIAQGRLLRSLPFAIGYATRFPPAPAKSATVAGASDDWHMMTIRHVFSLIRIANAASTAGDTATVLAQLQRLSVAATSLPQAQREALLSEAISNYTPLVASLGKPAPRILAHAWLNTADSLYHATPSGPSLDDGRVRVVILGNMDSELLSLLSSIQQKVEQLNESSGARNVDLIFMTHTTGHVGPDLSSVLDEIAWLHHYYRTIRNFRFPIAVWASEFRPVSYGGHTPQPSPMLEQYPARGLQYMCLIVDGHGIVRAYKRLRTRADAIGFVGTLSSMIRDRSSSKGQ